MHAFDIELNRQDVQNLHNADSISAFFTKLGYATSSRTTQTAANLAVPEATSRDINKIELLADHEGFFQVYLFELKSITVANIKGLARAFKNRAGNFLFVLTSDYEDIEFVLLDREIAENTESEGIGQQRSNIVSRRFSVDRRHPTAVHLRVLRRLTWTETDPFGQFDKLRCAYDVAYWSETHFNNRGLFSDYFLTERLRPKSAEAEFPEWQDDPKPAYQKMRAIYEQASARFMGKKLSDLEELLYEPLLRELGFELKRDKASKTGAQLQLLDDGKSKNQLAVCLAYSWGRELDRKDEKRDPETPEVTPAFAVVDLLAKEKAPWVMLTNGKIWRLYSKEAHSRATNYYEVDLDEVFGRQGFQQDIQDSFRYFWLLFRAQSFRRVETQFQGKVQSLNLLDRLLLGSQAYAKQLGDSLKDRVFTRAFPVFAEGFIEHMRQKSAARAQLSDTELVTIFQGTLTLLYRLLFLLYAESRDLLPIHAPEYRQASLQRLKSQIAEAAGTIAEETEDYSARTYSIHSYVLWARLRTLFGVIDKGSEDLNVPRYNGGLFQAERSDEDHSPEAEATRFLESEKIPDRHLARGIDLLARGVDEKRHDLVAVDYKSLGVRQLGSIYEGLLEFRLRIAPEKLGVVKEKDREVYKAFRELTEKERARSERQGKAVQKGRAYLENDKRERKATGSYYTPDHIVKFIVARAVGPVLGEKFEALRPELREAQRQRREFFKQREQFIKRGMPPKAIEQADLKGRHLVEKVFDVKALDPAMGSGHFLVEAVDFITDKTLEFLNAFPWNPVLGHLAEMRKTIQDQMDEQNIEIDFNRLTDVNLLKRHVLKRCIYGVDLNPMAVELAKVSLWLDCFTLGAPLSFLDHHLRCGNSLIGTTIAEVDAIREAKGQLALTGTSDWQGLTQAVQAMVDIGGMPDITPSQVADSKRHYQSATADVEVFKRVLDLHAARWFVKNASSKLGGRKVDIFDEMLRSGELFEWAHERLVSPVSHSGMAEAGKVAVRDAGFAAEREKFFHWELEFPETFYRRRPGTVNAIERASSPGFDCVVGNPPYDELSESALGRELREVQFLTAQETYSPLGSGRLNWYHFFIKRSIWLTRPGGYQAFIVPMSLMGDQFTRALRSSLLESGRFLEIEAFPQKDDPNRRIFFDAKLPTCVYVVHRGDPSSEFRVRTHAANVILPESPAYIAELTTIQQLDPINLPIPLVSEEGWEILQQFVRNPDLGKLKDYGAVPTSGEIVFNKQFRKYLSESPTGTLILRGSHVQRWEIVEEAKQGEPLYLRKDLYLKDARKGSKAFDFKQPRVVYQECAAIDNWRRVIAAYLPAGHFCGHKICYFIEYKCSPMALLAVFNSKLIDWITTAMSTNNSLPAYLIAALPFPRFSAITEEVCESLSSEIRAISEAHESPETAVAGLVELIERKQKWSRLQIAHAIMAYLGEAMVRLTDSKQQGEREWAWWLNAQLFGRGENGDLGLDALSGKNSLKNFLGDYQRNEENLSFDSLWDILVKNSRNIGHDLNPAFKQTLADKYQAVMSALLPLKRKLSATDRMIDLLVYRLYSLKADQVVVIEASVNR